MGLRGGYGLAPPGYDGSLHDQAILQHGQGLVRPGGGSGQQVEGLPQGVSRLGRAHVSQQLGLIAESRAEAGAIHPEVRG